jgi:O-antigen/teichoic acid export membrane protein
VRRYASLVRARVRGGAIAAGQLTVAGAIFQAGSFGATVVVARLLGRSLLGEFAVATAIGSVVVAGLGGGVANFAQRELAAGRAEPGFLRACFRAEVGVTAAASLLATLLGLLVFRSWTGLAYGATTSAANVVLAEFALVSSMLAGLQDYRAVATAQIFAGAAIPLLTLAVIGAGVGVWGALLAPGLAAVPPGAWLIRRLGPLGPRRGFDAVALVRRSLAFLGVGFSYGGYQKIDALVVLPVAGAATAGTYSAAYRLLSPFMLLGAGFGRVLFTSLAAAGDRLGDWGERRRRATRQFAAVMLPLVVIAVAVLPELMTGIYGPSFASARTPCRILLLSVVPFTLYWPSAIALQTWGRERTLLSILVFSTVVEALLVLWWAPRYGAVGAAWAWLATETTVLVGVSVAWASVASKRAATRPDEPAS